MENKKSITFFKKRNILKIEKIRVNYNNLNYEIFYYYIHIIVTI